MCISFEDKYNQLKKICERAEDSNLNIEDRLSLYKEGIIKYNECKNILAEKKQEIEIIEVTSDER